MSSGRSGRLRSSLGPYVHSTISSTAPILWHNLICPTLLTTPRPGADHNYYSQTKQFTSALSCRKKVMEGKGMSEDTLFCLVERYTSHRSGPNEGRLT
ncbi:hypothetical protein MHYP_G00150190 [Metynnis hypsauchen]